MKNEFEICGDNTIIHMKSRVYGEMMTVISTSKLEKVNSLPGTWHVIKSRKTFYAVINTWEDGKGGRCYLHRLITDAPTGYDVDHINHDGLNNTDENLRVVTRRENQQNRNRPNSSSKSRILGVSWKKQIRRWVVQVNVQGKQKTVGCFVRIEDAEKAALEARSKYYAS